MKVKSLSCVRLFGTPWTVAYQASLSIEFSRQEYWSGLSFPSPAFCHSHDISCHNSKNRAQGNEKKQRLTVLKTIKMPLVRLVV